MSNNLLHPDTSNLPYYVASYKGRSVAIKRDPDYQNTIKLVQKSIPKLRSIDARDVFLSTALENYGGALVQISEEIWPDIVDQVKVVEVVLEGDDEQVDPAGVVTSRVVWTPRDESTITSQAPASQTRDAVDEATLRQGGNSSVNGPSGCAGGFPITICTTSQKLLKLDGFCPSSRIEQIMSLLEAEYVVPAILQRLELYGKRLKRTETIEQSGITEWTTIDLFLNARQCMISIYADPQVRTNTQILHEDIEVQYSVNRAWELSTLFPSRREPHDDYIRKVTWNVDVKTSWTLFDRGSQTEVTSIFWDGISKSHQPTAPDLSLSQSRLAENPLITAPLLDPSNSIMMPAGDVDGYISNFLYCLGFNQGIKPSYEPFVSQIKQSDHKYLALRILSQAEHKTMASLSTSPEVRNISSVFVLYKGLSKLAAGAWDISLPRNDVGSSNNIWVNHLGNLQSTREWRSLPGIKVFEFAWMEVC